MAEHEFNATEIALIEIRYKLDTIIELLEQLVPKETDEKDT